MSTKNVKSLVSLFLLTVLLAVLAGCSAPVKQTTYEYKFPAWCPDGRICAIKKTTVEYDSGGGLGWGGGSSGSVRFDLVVFDDDGSNEHAITEVSSDAGFISVSTSGNYIGYAVNNSIKVIDWSGNVSLNIGTGDNTGAGQRFDWSPDEKNIVFHNDAYFYVFDVENKTSINVTATSAEPSWKYNIDFVFNKQNKLTFSDKNGSITTTNVDLSQYVDPQYVNGTTKVAYFDKYGKIYYYDINTQIVTSQNIGLGMYGYYADIDKDGDKITYTMNNSSIYVMNIDGTNQQRIK